MEAKELRIGNYVTNEMHGIGIVNGVSERMVLYSRNYDGLEINRINPIPLTEEWLINFGFEKKDNNYTFLEWRFHINKPGNYDGFLFCEGYSVITDRIKYVHHLQNLYFALTGEELTLND